MNKTQTALSSVEVLESGQGIFDMASRYISDAEHSLGKEDLVTAFAQIEYAHGLLDGGVGAGVLKVLENSELFVFKSESNVSKTTSQ